MESAVITDITKNSNIAKISVFNIENIPGKACGIFSVLAKRSISIDIILSIGNDITFTVSEDKLDEAVSILQKEFGGIYGIKYTKAVSKVSVTGSGMINRPGILAAVLEAVESVFIDIQMISSSEMSISLILDKYDAARAVSVLREQFGIE